MKIRTKIEAVILVGAMILAGYGLGVYATRTITDTSDSIYTSIITSSGGVYPTTFAGLQDAFDSLNNQTGTVYQPGNSNITATNTLYLGNHATYDAQGGTLYLGNGVNKSIICNYNVAQVSAGIFVYNGENTDIHIRNLVLDGNQYHNPRFISGTNRFRMPDGIRLTCTNYSSIDHVTIKDTINNGIYFSNSNFIEITNCYFDDIGKNWTGYTPTTGLEPFSTYGVRCDSSENISISHLESSYCHNGLVALEKGGMTGISQPKSHHFIISDCIANGGYTAIRIENAYTGEVNNCFAYNITRKDVYLEKKPVAFTAALTSHDATFKGCTAIKCGNTIGLNGTAFSSGGYNNTFDGCYAETIYGNGSVIEGRYNRILNCVIKNASWYGIYVRYDYFQVVGNKVFNAVKAGIYCSPATTGYKYQAWGLIADNVIRNFTAPSGGGTSAVSGIFCSFYNTSITGNTISNYIRGIHVSAAQRVLVSSNTITSTSSDGIYLTSCKNSSATNNLIQLTAGYGINIRSCSNSSAIGNTITSCTFATGTIGETDSGIDPNNNLIVDNVVSGGNTNNAIVRLGTNTIVSNNLGYFSVQLPTSAPSTPAAGSMYVNVTTGDIAVYSGTAWIWTHG